MGALSLMFFVLCSNFLLIKSEGEENLKISIPKDTGNCSIPKPNYKFREGQNLTIELSTDPFVNYGWWRLKNSNNETFTIDSSFKSNMTKQHTTVVNRYMDGTWEFEFYVHKDNVDILSNIDKVAYPAGKQEYYTPIICRTNVAIEMNKDTILDTKFIIICSVLGTLALLIIIGQAVYICYLKSLARRLNAHNNLSKKSDSAQSDGARYCSYPRQKKIDEVVPVDKRYSDIYEAPNIEITDNGQKHFLPPNPPAISTMPCTPKMDRNMGVHPQMHGATLNRSAMMDHTHSYQRQTERDMANRPPLPLPPSQDDFEVYEQMTDDMDTYEPPPVVSQAMPPRLPMPPKKVPTANLVNVKEDTLKTKRSARPPVTPKPQMSHAAVAPVNELQQVLKRRQAGIETATRSNELEEALRKRNNVKQVPIVSIPDPSPAKTRPVVKSKPRIPQPQPVQEEIYYNENQASSDEEWTYEPLKPHKNYDPNIYNI
uniref:p77 homologue n=1 Tax=Spodoptera litura TaxID=69820 RepID=E0D3H4_SPOLT|nr:p77 homologue [Spodoptera litura]